MVGEEGEVSVNLDCSCDECRARLDDGDPTVCIPCWEKMQESFKEELNALEKIITVLEEELNAKTQP